MTASGTHSQIDPRTKGIPRGTGPLDIGPVGHKGWNVLSQDLPLPLAILSEPAIANNEEWMKRFCADVNVSLAPHGKTTMCPQLFQRQIAAGAWAITLSTAHQVQVARAFGIGRVLLANQLVDPRFIDAVMGELDADEAFDFMCLVDSADGVRIAGERIRAGGFRRKLGVLVEIGADGGRTGARSATAVSDIVAALKDYADVIAVRGVECFEGIFAGTPDEKVAKVKALMTRMVEATRRLDGDGLFSSEEIVLSAGGSAYFDIVTDYLGALTLSRPTRVVLRSGCYIAHDGRMYRDYFAGLKSRSSQAQAQGGALKPALQVAAYVQSRPEPGLVLLTAGKRDLSYDAHLPEPAAWFRPGQHDAPVAVEAGYAVFELADQHAFMRVPEDSTLKVGDIVFLNISHPCTTFDKWDVLYGVDDAYNVVTLYKTYF